MPRVSAFYGIVIYMYWNERDHPVPHVHAYHGGQRASISIDGHLLAGSLAPRPMTLIVEWLRIHRTELLDNWELARRNQPLLAVPPLP